ncbi:hypothetical protein ES703_51855 [subsurface metagenome]
MRKSDLGKVRRVYRAYVKYKTRKGIRSCGPYWQGRYWENGRSVTVYIGKELPDNLRYLLEGRYKRPGCEDYTWPGLKEGGRNNVKTPGER